MPKIIDLLAAITILATINLGACQAPPVADWSRTSPENAGLPTGLPAQIDAGINEGPYKNLHAVIIVRDGKIALENYYQGVDEAMSRPLGDVAFDANTLHDIRSVTKSVVSLLYGIALGENLVPPTDTSLLDQFPEYADLAADPERRKMTVGNALSMQLGTEWDERISYRNPRNSETAMERASDRYRFVLDRPMVATPGTQWVYNGGTTALIGRLIEKGSGQPLAEFARERLFTPLDIATFEWARGRDGAYMAASGLRLRPRDLARIGQLVLDGGRWNGRQIIPEDWLAQSFTVRVTVRGDDIGYGYQWWLSRPSYSGPQLYAGMGNGGQRLFIVPQLDLVVVVTAGNYNRRKASRQSTILVTDVILPNVQAE